MSKEELKSIPVEVSKECWKKLKIAAIEKDLSLSEFIRQNLEKSFINKKKEEILNKVGDI